MQKSATNYSALSTLTLVFFFWGFIAAGNSIFIPFCKNYFILDQFQSQLIDFAFYLAYYIGALALFAIGSSTGKDIVGYWGYKKSIIYGLIFSALGAGAMIISVYFNVFSGMLVGLFVVALGFSLQQTSANPFMIALGDEATGSNRINLGGGINSLGTLIGPLILALALFGTAASVDDDMIKSLSLNKVIILYACVGALFIGVAILLGVSKKVPAGIKEEKPEKAMKALRTLVIITGLLITCFVPVFSSYLSTEQKQIEILQADNKIEQNELEKICSENGFELNDESSLDLQNLYNINEVSSLTQKKIDAKLSSIKEKEKIVSTLSQPLENNRIIWLACGLLVIILGILFAHFKKNKNSEWGAMQYPQLTLGMLAIFFYVGVEVAIGSNLGELLKQDNFGGYSSSDIAPFIAMFWGSLMIGRWTGSINVFPLSKKVKLLLKFVVPLVAFGVVLLCSKLAGYKIDMLYWYVLCVVVQIIAFVITKDKPVLTLSVFGSLGIIALITSLSTSGTLAIYSILSCGLFCSIMWPCIFSLSIAGIGKYQGQGATFLIMMILGGAIIPPIQGKLADFENIGIQNSFFIGVICFAYLTFFAIYVGKLLKKQGVSFDDEIASH